MCLFLANFLRCLSVVWSLKKTILMALCLDVCSLHRTSCHSKEASILRETSRHFSQKKERRRHCSPPEILSMLWSGEVLFLSVFLHCFPQHHNFFYDKDVCTCMSATYCRVFKIMQLITFICILNTLFIT